jgi:hypothetical protein
LRGHLDNLLPTFKKAQRVTHDAALPYVEVGGFVDQLHQVDQLHNQRESPLEHWNLPSSPLRVRVR